jgi:mannose-6-phosphate isomerase-like protein (cupin superfamily)
MPSKINAAALAPEPWGDGCKAWRLLAGADLAVAEELMPPGTAEIRHRHHRARQFFYVLAGELTMEQPDGSATLQPGDGLEIPPQLPHRACNKSQTPVRFLVISVPTTINDREPIT